PPHRPTPFPYTTLFRSKSLLPIGMTGVEGDFSRGDVIAVRDARGLEVARGLANYASAEARLLCRKSSGDFERLLGYAGEAEMIQDRKSTRLNSSHVKIS